MNYFLIKKKQSDANGKVGQYIRLTKKIGVKLVGFNGCISQEKLEKSLNWLKAVEEANWLKLVNSINLSPKCYGVHPVKFKGKFFAGVFMDHIDGGSLNDFTENGVFNMGSKVYLNSKGFISKKGKLPIIKFLKDKLDSIKVNHKDIHGENVLIDKNNKVWLIDFSPDYIKRKRKQ
jgi:predicted Ser/Thr protein kinase